MGEVEDFSLVYMTYSERAISIYIKSREREREREREMVASERQKVDVALLKVNY